MLDSSRMRFPAAEMADGMPERAAADGAPGTFVGMVSPFAEDTTPLEAEPLQPWEASSTHHMRSRSAGE